MSFGFNAAGHWGPLGYSTCLMDNPPSTVAALAQWRHDADPVRCFADDRLRFGAGWFETSGMVYSAWKAWAEENGVKLALTSRGLTARLKQVCPQIETGEDARLAGKRGIRGVQLLTEDA